MKKLLIAGVVSLFAVSLVTSSAFAFGDCAGKSKHTKVADSTKVKKEKS